ncbi:flagellar hook-length control protein FliK [Pseudoalteromonas undina]|uniref:flagellar hook-length control protein FliK n=1 Tax=Pseudoalteromonas undina TaxID=43660 RepID=UPI00186832E0|nr:flagellar hook-length control protein FliK [Pseudoalteromonas undina]
MNIQANSMTTKADFGSATNKPTILKSSTPADAQELQSELEPFTLSSKQQQTKQQNVQGEQPQESSEQLAQEDARAETQEIINPYFFSTANYNLDTNKISAPVKTLLNPNSNLGVDSEVMAEETPTAQLVTNEQLQTTHLETQSEDSFVTQEPAKTTPVQNIAMNIATTAAPTAAINVTPANTVVNKELNTLEVDKAPQTLYSQALLNRLNQPSVVLNTYAQAQSSSLTSEQVAIQPSVSLSKLELAALSQSAQSKMVFTESRESTGQKSTLVNAFSSAATAPETFEWQKEKLKEAPSEWGQRLLHVLGDKVKLQIGQQLQRAQIRLDPPNLGSIEISINIEGDKTSVSLTTSNAQVRDAIAQTLDQLRQSLSQNSSTTVDVNLSDKQQQSQQQLENNEIANNQTESPSHSDTASTHSAKSPLDWLDLLV